MIIAYIRLGKMQFINKAQTSYTYTLKIKQIKIKYIYIYIVSILLKDCKKKWGKNVGLPKWKVENRFEEREREMNEFSKFGYLFCSESKI